MTGQELVTQYVEPLLKAQVDRLTALNALIQVELTGEGGGKWLIDATKNPPILTAGESASAVSTISMDIELFRKILQKETQAPMAFMTGQIKVAGSLGTAIKFGQILD